MKRRIDGKKTLRAFAALLLAALCLLAASCGVAAPSGMFAPEENEGKYVEGVEHAIFAVPEDYTVTMSSNTLAALRGQSVFSLQCRHSDYYYTDAEGKPNLDKNFEELRAQLISLYGDFTAKLDRTAEVAGQKALAARYSLEISGEKFDYAQYFFYEADRQFYLFTYSSPAGTLDEELLSKVLSSVSLDKEHYTAPDGMKAVENATVEKISFDRYEIYIPDDWILDTTAGQICMRVPSSRTFATVMFHEIDCGGSLKDYTDAYAEKFAAGVDLGSVQPLEKYILASVYRMMKEYKDFRIVTDAEKTDSPQELSRSDFLTLKDDYLMARTTGEKVEFNYIEYTATLANFNKHSSGGLFSTGGDDSEPEELPYRIRQYFTYKGDKIYLITYIAKTKADSGTDAFPVYESDALKVVDNFVLR